MIKYDDEDIVPSKPVATTAAEFSAIDRQITTDYIATQPAPTQPAPTQPVDFYNPNDTNVVVSTQTPIPAAEFSAIDRQITTDYIATQPAPTQPAPTQPVDFYNPNDTNVVVSTQTPIPAAVFIDDRKKSNALTTQQFEALAAPGATTRGLTTTYTPSTIVDSALALKLADAYGGQPSDYKSKTSAQLADIIGGTPTNASQIMASGVIDQSATPSKARNIWESVTPWEEDKGQTFGKVVEDTFRETVSLGKIQTDLYNKEEIASDFTKLQTQQDMDWFVIQNTGRDDYIKSANAEYSQAAASAIASGQMLTMTREQYLAQSAKDYDKWVTDNKPKPGTLSVLDDKGKTVTFNSKTEYATWLRNQQPTTGNLAKEFGIGLIPIVGTVRNWGSMGGVGRGASIFGDLLFVVPVIGWIGGAAVKTGATVAKTASIGGRIGNIATSSARLTVDVAKGGGALLKGMVTTPINLIRAPVATTKAGLTGLKTFGTGYVGAFKAGLKPTNIKAFGETLIGGKVYAPKLGGALVGGQTVKQIRQIEGTRPMTQGDVAALAKADISDIKSKMAIPPKETFTTPLGGNAPKGQNVGMTYVEKPQRLIVENPNLLDSPVSPVMASQTRKLTEQELLGGLDIVEPGLAGGKGVTVKTPTPTQTSSGISTAPQKVALATSVTLAPAIAISPIFPSSPVTTPIITPITTPYPSPIPVTTPIISPVITPTPVVTPIVTPLPVATPLPVITPTPVLSPRPEPIVSPQPMPQPIPTPIVTPVTTPIPVAPATDVLTPKFRPPPFLPLLPFKMQGGGGGVANENKPSLNSMVGQWQTKGLFVGIIDPETGEVIVGGIKGRTKLKHGNVPYTLKSRLAGGGNVASAGGRLIKRVNVV
jgi:hypothetical protein